MIPEKESHWQQPALGPGVAARPPGMELDSSKVKWLKAPDGSWFPTYAGFYMGVKPPLAVTQNNPSIQTEQTQQNVGTSQQGYYTSASKMPQQNIQPIQEAQQVDNLIDIREEDMELEERWPEKSAEEPERQRTGDVSHRRGRTIDERLQGMNPEGGETLADIRPRYPNTEERPREENRGRNEGRNKRKTRLYGKYKIVAGLESAMIYAVAERASSSLRDRPP